MVLNGKVINPGELRTLVTLGTRAVSVETGGFRVGMVAFTAITGGEVWARWENVHGSEAWAAQAANVQEAATVLIRYRADVEPTMGVKLGANWYEIVSMDNIQNRNEYIELKVKRVVAA